MRTRTFDPWIDSANFGRSRYGHLLIVGESHYGTQDNAHAAFTAEVIERHLSERDRQSLLTKIIGALFPEAETRVKEAQCWRQVAF